MCASLTLCARFCFCCWCCFLIWRLILPNDYQPVDYLCVCVFKSASKIHSTEIKTIGDKNGRTNETDRPWGGGRGAHNVAITARETSVCYVCPTKSSFKIDIKSTARSITKFYCGSCSFNLLQSTREVYCLAYEGAKQFLFDPLSTLPRFISCYKWLRLKVNDKSVLHFLTSIGFPDKYSF